MPDSVRELIMQHVQTTLEGITTANGYSTTLNAVERLLQQGQSVKPPMAYVIEGDDTPIDDTSQDIGLMTLRNLEIGIEAQVIQDEAVDSRSASEVMNLLIADIQRAMEADYTRGGHAINTTEMGVDPILFIEGRKKLVTVIGYRILYRHRRTDPRVEV